MKGVERSAMSKNKRTVQRAKRTNEHQRWVDELRRSNAAGTHGNDKYNRRTKYKPDYRSNDDQEFHFQYLP